MINVALFGPPGAGKGTQSKLLINKYNLTYISTGDILRQEIAEGTELGMQAKSIIEKGGLASDEVIVQIIERKIQMNPDARGILFDGFPRTVVQAYILEGLFRRDNASLLCMLSLEVPKEELMRRMLERANKEGRADDKEEVIKVRLQEYENKTLPVANFYKEKGKYFPINGVGKLTDIFNRLTATIDKELENIWLNVVLYGPPGAGKGTQAKLIAAKYNLVYISTGEMIRREIELDTETGRIAKEYVERGDVVPDEIAIRLIERKIKLNPNAKGFIFKGFPSTLVQAYILDGLLWKMGSSLTSTIEISSTPIQCMKRLTARSKTPNARIYDKETDVIIHRLEVYEERCAKVKEYYQKQNKLESVNGLGNEEEVFEDLCHVIDNVFRKVK
jgi:adenylate kinase